MPQYQLAPDVFLCLSGNHFVFLDLRRNKYLCLNRRNTQIAMRILIGFSESADVLNEKRSDDNLRVVEALLDAGLVARRDDTEHRLIQLPIQVPSRALPTPVYRQTSSIRASHAAVFLRASLKASAKLRWYSMHDTVHTVRKRKHRRVRRNSQDREPLAELVAAFRRLRPFYMRNYRCLYDSLALVEFLAQYDYFPQWVFGVRAEPFNAHCWVQEGEYLLNDITDNVRTYTPIMAV